MLGRERASKKHAQLTWTITAGHLYHHLLSVYSLNMAPNDKAGRVVFIGNIPYGTGVLTLLGTLTNGYM